MKYSNGPGENASYKGEGFQGLKGDHKYEPMGVHRSAPNPKLAHESGFGGPKDGSEGKGFDPMAAGYVSPDRKALDPGAMKTRQPEDVKSSV